MSGTRQVALVAAVATVVMFTNLGGSKLWDRDEPRNAGCAAEMLARGDWVTPTFNGELRAHKPVLLYWLMMSAYQVFGVNEFAARFWSAALAVGTVVCTCAVGRRLFSAPAGVWAGVVLSSSLMFGVAGRAATPDSVLIFFSTLAIAIYVWGTFRAREAPSEPLRCRWPGHYFPRHWAVAAAMYAAMGAAVLAKGPVGLVLPTAVIGMFLLIMRLPPADPNRQLTLSGRLRRGLSVFAPLHFLRTCWMMRPITAVTICLAVALPWYAWVGLRTDGDFLRGFFLEHNFGRAMQPMEGHGGSLLFYPVAVLIGFFPWSVLAVPLVLDSVAGARSDGSRRVGYLFASCWIGVYVGLFTLASTKLPSYVTPCYPGLALLTGSFLHRWIQGTTHGSLLWRRLAFASLALVGLGLVVALPWAANRYLPGDEWLGAIGLIPIAGGLGCLVLIEKRSARSAVLAFSITAVSFSTLLFGGVAARVSQHQQAPALLARVEQSGQDAPVASFGLLEPSWVFYAGRTIDELHGSDAVRRWIDRQEERQPKGRGKSRKAAEHRPGCFVITNEAHLEQLRALLPPDFEVLADAPFFLEQERLVLLGRAAPEKRIARQADKAPAPR